MWTLSPCVLEVLTMTLWGGSWCPCSIHEETESERGEAKCLRSQGQGKNGNEPRSARPIGKKAFSQGQHIPLLRSSSLVTLALQGQAGKRTQSSWLGGGSPKAT